MRLWKRPWSALLVAVQTNSGRILAGFEDDNQPAQGQTFPVFSSTDNGASWTKIASVADTSPSIQLYKSNDSDERDKAHHDQKIVHQASADGVTWGPVVEDVAMADRALRPGMPVVTRTAPAPGRRCALDQQWQLVPVS